MITQQHQDRLVAQGRDELMTAWIAALPSAPTETKQREASERFTAFMQELVPQIVGVVAVGDYPAFAVKLDNIDGKGKIALKAANVDEAGPALITHMGASLTLVLTDAAQFDRKRPAANIDPDQKPLPMGEGEDDSTDEEVDELVGDEPNFDDQGVTDAENGPDLLDIAADGPLFSVVDVGFKPLPGGEEVSVHLLLHRDLEVFEPIAAPEFVQSVADKLNELVMERGRDLSPFEVRDQVIANVPDGVGIALKPPYTTEAIQNSSAPEEAKARAGRKSDLEKAEAANAGWDAAAAGVPLSDCPHAKGALKDRWVHGWSLQKDGKDRPFLIGDSDRREAANDDEAPLYGASPNGQDSTGKAA